MQQVQQLQFRYLQLVKLVSLQEAPDAAQGEVIAAGIKYAFYFITGISVVALICSLFMKKPSEVKVKSPATVKATEPVRE